MSILTPPQEIWFWDDSSLRAVGGGGWGSIYFVVMWSLACHFQACLSADLFDAEWDLGERKPCILEASRSDGEGIPCKKYVTLYFG